MKQTKTMNALEAQLHYPFGDSLPAVGQSQPVAPGVRWIRMALPFALDHINLWLLRDQIDGVSGWSVVDCCIDHAQSRTQWGTIFAQELEGLPILRVIVTHMHPDHIGLAHWLCAHWNVALWISATDYYVARLACLGRSANNSAHMADFFALHGMGSAETREQLRLRDDYFPKLVPAVPERFVRLMDGASVQIGGHTWRCISGYGHAPEHIALYCEGLQLLIGGDMVLPRISTNVSVYDQEPEANALQQFLDSIDKFKPLPENTLVLPSHGKPFTGLHTRIEQLHAHHRDRLAEVMQACAERPCSAADILPVLFKRPLDFHQTTFALGESVAHLNALWLQGQLLRQQNAQGVYQFSVSPAALPAERASGI
jgi:glyoxylase-like metal-dependent hydrolase (beta-lactamase superfamily II)